MIEVNEIELKNALFLIDEINSGLIQRGKEKMNAEERGFGENSYIDNIVFSKDSVYLDYNNSRHDLKDFVCVILTIPEICMTDQDWEAYIIEITNERNKLKQEQVRTEKENEKENRRKQYFKLKKEFDD